MDTIKKLSPAVFVLIILCFFLPFVNLSCGGQTIMSLSGFQLITGAKVSPADNLFGGFKQEEFDEKERVDPQPMAILAFIMALAGLGLSFIKRKKLAIITVIVSALGLIFLILLKVNMDGESDLGAQYIITLDYQFGYWFSLLLFAAGVVIFGMIFKEAETVSVPPDIPPSGVPKV